MPTPNWGLPILTGTEAMSFKGLYNAQSNALETGMDNLSRASGIAKVASVAARTALFPSPAQGNSVFRTDTGTTETYFSSGVQVAGWYPTSGRVPFSNRLRMATSQVYTSGSNVALQFSEVGQAAVGITYSGSTFTVPQPGRYLVTAVVGGAFTTSARFIVGLTGSFAEATQESAIQANLSTSWNRNTAILTFPANGTLQVTVRQDSGVNIAMNGYATLNYLNPA